MSGGFGPAMQNSLPCYAAPPITYHYEAIDTPYIEKPDMPYFNISNRIPFDGNWGRNNLLLFPQRINGRVNVVDDWRGYQNINHFAHQWPNPAPVDHEQKAKQTSMLYWQPK